MLFKITIAASILLLTACEPKTTQNGNNSNNNDTNNGNTKPTALSYKGKKLILTKHAKCRMGCRYIDESEIMDIIADNNINARKSTSTAENGKCPTTAYEGISDDKQELRIIVAYCEGDEVARVVTVIDTGNDFNCVCD
jgi:Domain of unknown function (DUF4258)